MYNMNKIINMFTYATLKHDGIRTSVLGKYTESIEGILYDYEIVNHSYSAYKTIQPKKGGIVEGIIFQCDKYDLLRLDRYENNMYDRIKVMVNDIECETYIERPKYIKCSLCDQQFRTNDPDLNIRTERHALGMHSRNRTIYSERDNSPSKPMGNHIYGKVGWYYV